MTAPRAELTVGIFALVIFALLTFMTFRVGEFTIGEKQGYIVYANFSDTAGLYEQSRIKVAGVDAGTLEKIGLVNGIARLTLRVDPEVILYSDASAGIRATGLLGDKYLDLQIGYTGPPLKDGDTIKYIEEFVDIDEMFQNLDELSQSITQIVATFNQPEMKEALRDTLLNLKEITTVLDTVVTENQDRINHILARVDSLTTSLDELVSRNQAPLSNTIANLEEFSTHLKTDGPELMADLSSTVVELKEVIQENRGDLKSLVTKTSSAMDSVNVIARKVERGEGTIGKLVHDESLYTSLTNAVSSVGKTLSAIERFKTFITFRGEYLERLGEARGGVYLTLQPKKDKYYILGVVGDPVGRVETIETFTNGTFTREDRVITDLEFTAHFARRFKDTALRIGLTETTFGLGADQFLLDDKLRLYVDAWDFGKDEHLAKNPHVSIGADYFLFKNFFVTGGLDNVFNSNRFGAYVGGGVRFEDEDFKYIFGSVPSISR